MEIFCCLLGLSPTNPSPSSSLFIAAVFEVSIIRRAFLISIFAFPIEKLINSTRGFADFPLVCRLKRS